MIFTELERAFQRAAILTFSKKKALLSFTSLLLCAILTIFCRASLSSASNWVAISLYFLPILLSSGILFALGVLLIRIHHHEAKQLKLYLKDLITTSLDLIVGALYLAIFPILIYLLFWIGLGVFFLLRSIPGLGDFFGVVFSFGPFLLILGSMLLCLLNIVVLFFVTPAAALQPVKESSVIKRLGENVFQKMLSSLLLFFLGILPLVLVGLLLVFAAKLTGLSFFIAEHSLSVALQWFFISIPFCGILTPFVIFFFNFSAESYQILSQK